MNILDYVVVGSGCSGAIAAQTLVEAGAAVTMVDVGITNPDNNALPAGHKFVDLRRQDNTQYKYLIGDNGQGINWDKLSKGAQVTPPRRYIDDSSSHFLPLSSTTFSPMESLSYGGLGIGWGLQCWEYSDSDLAKVGLPVTATRSAYNTVSKWIGISATNDEAAPYTINTLQHFQPSATADKNHRLIQRLYKKRKKSFQKQGIYVGRTPLALITKKLGNRKAYRYLDTDFYSDADKSAWRPWITVDALRKKQNFQYMGNLLVTSFEEKGDVVIIHATNTVSGKKQTLQCRHLILASGALGTARIVIRSQATIGTRVPLLSNPHSYIPCIQPGMFGKGYEAKKLGFGQLSYFIDPKGSDEGISVASSYSYQSLMLFRIIAQLPFNFADGRILSRFLTTGLVIMIAQHPDTVSPNKYLKLVKDTSSPTGDKIEAHYQPSSEEEKLRDKREKRYLALMRKLHTYPLKRVKTEHGTAIHYAGTLPFSSTPKALHLSARGKLHNTKHVYVADSSGFHFLPAKGLTFTLMANAHLVAKNVLEGEPMDTSKQPTIAITGASGFLGTQLVHHFAKKNWNVIALVRTPSKGEFHQNVEYRAYDITKPIPNTALQGVDYLIHAAYVKLDAATPNAMVVNISGAKQLLAAAKAAKVTQSVFISTMSAHDDAISIYGKQKLAIEKLFLAAKNTTVLRCGLIIGNGGIVREMAAFMQSKHAVPLIGGGTQPLQVVAVSDLTNIISNVLTRSLHGQYVAAHPKVYSYRQFYIALARQLKVKVVLVPLPYWALQAAFKIASLLPLKLGVGEDNLKGLKMLRAMESRSDLQRIGVQPVELEKALSQAHLT